MELWVRPHGAALVRPLTRAVLLAAAGGAGVLLGSGIHWGIATLGALAVTLGALLALATVWGWERTTVVLSGEALEVSWGIARRHVARVTLDRGAPIEIEQGIVGRILGYGTLVAGELQVPYVPLRSEH